MKKEELIYGMLQKVFLDRIFLKETGFTKKSMEAYMESCNIRDMAVKLAEKADSKGRYNANAVVKTAANYLAYKPLLAFSLKRLCQLVERWLQRAPHMRRPIAICHHR